jgi:hypothetical protein
MSSVSLKKALNPCSPSLPKEQFNLDGTASVKTIHNWHQHQPASILKNSTTNPKSATSTKTDEVDLSKDNDSSSGDSASQESSSSDKEDDHSSSDKGSRSNNSNKDDEEMSAAGSG